MKLQLLSDLHLERDPGFVPVAAPGADVLVLAGDVGSYQAGSRLTGDDFGLGRFSPLRPDAPWRQVLYVPGNHEFDGLEFAPTYARLRATCEALGITWLEQEVVVIGGVRFVGSTLWADFDALAATQKTLTGQLKARDKAFRAANFYLRRFGTLQDGKPMLAEAMRELALASQAWLRTTLAVPFDGHTVVVTHFAPSLRSTDPRYGLTPGTAGFCNGLDELLPQASLWLHGHLHCHHDYVVQGESAGRAFRCRVVANPLGYAAKGEQQGFEPQLLVEVPGPGSP
jgi:predicted phosphodiesterase